MQRQRTRRELRVENGAENLSTATQLSLIAASKTRLCSNQILPSRQKVSKERSRREDVAEEESKAEH